MSLPAGQQRILDGIAETMRLTEPRLTTMFAIFTRLTKNEPRPRREQLAAAEGRGQALLAWRSERTGPGWRRAILISQMALALIVLAVLTFVTAHSGAACGTPQPRPDAIAAPHQEGCLAPGRSGVGFAGK